jgi:hypothetical protein
MARRRGVLRRAHSVGGGSDGCGGCELCLTSVEAFACSQVVSGGRSFANAIDAIAKRSLTALDIFGEEWGELVVYLDDPFDREGGGFRKGKGGVGG